MKRFMKISIFFLTPPYKWFKTSSHYVAFHSDSILWRTYILELTCIGPLTIWILRLTHNVGNHVSVHGTSGDASQLWRTLRTAAVEAVISRTGLRTRGRVWPSCWGLIRTRRWTLWTLWTLYTMWTLWTLWTTLPPPSPGEVVFEQSRDNENFLAGLMSAWWPLDPSPPA